MLGRVGKDAPEEGSFFPQQVREKWWPAARHGLDNWLKYHENTLWGFFDSRSPKAMVTRSGQVKHQWNVMIPTGGSRGGGNPAMAPPKAQEGGPSCLSPLKLPKSFYFYCSFFRKWIWVHPKNSGLNPWSFEFWRCPRLEPRAKLPPPPPKKKKPAAGSASDDTFHIISLIKRHLPLLLI